MVLHRILNRLFFIIVLFITSQGFSQLSKTHYIPPLTESGTNSSLPQDHYIYISTPSASAISFTIKPVGLGIGSYITGTVSNALPYTYNIGNGRNTQLFVNVNETSTIKSNKGYIIESQGVVYVSVRVNAGAQAGALVSKGLAALGTTFRIGSYTNENPQDNYLNFVSVMATEDNTQVTFSDLPAGLIIENYTGTTPVSVILNKGESYTLATNSNNAVVNRDGLIGCLVSSDKPIVVNCGSANGSFHNGGARDYGIDQIVGLDKVGTEYIFVKGDGLDGWENVLIVAHTNNTTISINGNTAVATINAGDYYLIEGNQYSTNRNMYVQTSQPVFAYQGIGATNSEANQGMFFVPPLSCETRGNLDNIAYIQSIGNTTYSGGITIVTKVGATVTINNLPISSFSTIGPNSVTGNTNYVTYKVLNLSGNISVQSTDELYCAYFNYNNNATSGSFYSGFPSPPEINFDAIFSTLGVCIPNVTLEVANVGSFDSFEWFYDDGTGAGFLTTGNTSLQYTPNQSGTYKLIGKLNCSGLTLESFEVPVSICPDDIDSDGIIDNIDIDSDNDGILNCTESNGNQNINLSNINGGSIPIGSYTYTGTVSTIGNIATIPLTGAIDGTFMSETPAKNGIDTSVIYDLNFNKNINLLFEYATSAVLGSGLLTDDEEFIIRVPNNRTITLLNANNQLLVDTNFDGVFESGVTQISSFEIRFKLNGISLALGTGTFSFSANGVNSFTLIHKNNSETNSNQATFKISATCVAKDTDSDGIEDALDFDSDNDGIPDFIENTGTLIALLGIDLDSNGLDDAYNINTTPLDSDSDGVYDFYDLDSDNDGIYDLIESGSGLPDIDFDGVIDNILTTMGLNGWDNNAETTPDSNLIGYPLNDLDTDTIFSYIDLDSDGDLCSDVIEAGFSDANGDNLLGDNIVTTGSNGKVTNASDGYTAPNSNYLNAAPISITTQPVDTESCELSNTIISLVSTTFDTIQWELSTDSVNWNTIVDDAIYSGSQTINLNILNTPLSYSSYQYRAFLNLAGNTCGLYSDEIKLTVIQLPVANTAPNMLLCDDDNNGTMPFDLTLQNNAINTTAGMTITYHSSQVDADTGNAPITNPFESGNTTIYARVENDLNTTCIATSSFNLEVYETPFPLNSPNLTPIQECDNTSIGTDTDGLIVFDLTQREIEILNGQSASTFTLTYFTDSGYTNQIAVPTTFSNTVAGGQPIYVRMTNNFYGTCFTDTSFDVEVYTLPQVNNPNIYQQCDDASNDGQAFFNLELNTIKEEINANYIAEGLTFTFFEDQTAAETNGITIANPSNYQDALGFTPETVWVRVENPNGCFRVVPLPLVVSPSSAALSTYNPTSIYQCDDGLNVRDGVATFDLTNIQNYIASTIFSTFNVTVDFYESQIDAELETNEIIDVANHQNTTSPNAQDIWVRVKSDLGNDCLGLEEFPNLLIVEALPIANQVPIQIECDNDAIINDGFYAFDTSLIESALLNGQPLTNVNISFTYLDIDGVTTINSSTLPNPFLTQSQVILARVTNNNTNDPNGACFDETSIEFKVDVQPIANAVNSQIVCDGDSGDIDNDGIFPFNTATFKNTILGTQSGMEVYFDYINENGINVINSTTLPNPLISGNQTINVEVINPLNTICTATTNINLVVNPLPDFTVNSSQIVCTSDPTFSIELDPLEASIVESFTYEWYFEDGTFLSNSSTLFVSTPGKYLVTLTKNNGTGCSRTREIIVNASEKATITLNDVTIVDISENNSVTINTTNLGRGDYEFALREVGTPFINYQNSPIFNNVKAGFYTIYINDKKGCSFTTLNISVIGHPKYFTPNGDGLNDFWQIKGISTTVKPTNNIFIYDRYGKLLKQLSIQSNGWDGTYNGLLLPTDDYWFKVFLEDGREYSGHFTLKR